MIKTLVGDPQLTAEELSRIVSKHKATHGDLLVERYDGVDIEYGELISTVSSVSLFEEPKLIVVQGLLKNAEISNKIDQLVGTVPEEQTLIIRETEIDKRSSGYKKLKQLTVFEELTSLKGADLIKALRKYCELELQALPSTQDLNYLISVCGEDIGVLKSELMKLAAYGDFSQEATNTLVDKQLSSKIFDLLEAAMNKNSVRALELYAEQREQRVEPQAILGLLVWQLNILLLSKVTKNIDQTSKSAGVSAYPLRKAQSLTRSMSFDSLNVLVQKTAETDIAIKRGAPADEAIRLLVLRFAN